MITNDVEIEYLKINTISFEHEYEEFTDFCIFS